MSLTIATYHTSQIPLSLVEQIADSLTRTESGTQQDMAQLYRCLSGQCPTDRMPEYEMSLATIVNPITDSLDCIGWASATQWNNLACLQAFVAADYRNMGLAAALASALVIDKHLSQENPLGVFSEEIARVAARLKFQDIRRYRRCDDGWVRTERLFDEPRGLVSQ